MKQSKSNQEGRKPKPKLERDRSMRAYLLNPRQLRVNPRERTDG